MTKKGVSSCQLFDFLFFMARALSLKGNRQEDKIDMESSSSSISKSISSRVGWLAVCLFFGSSPGGINFSQNNDDVDTI